MKAMNEILLVGTGQMGMEYAKTLQVLKRPFIAVGRGQKSSQRFSKETGVEAVAGGIDAWLVQSKHVPHTAIVSVSENELGRTAMSLLSKGISSMLIEKPGGFTPQEIRKVGIAAKKRRAKVYVAYNRRFYASVQAVEPLIRKDGGITSLNFEFTEWSHVIRTLQKAKGVKERWFLHNSTHVIDLAFFLAGQPKSMTTYHGGKLPWHPSGSRFAGAGVTTKGALFSYQANWGAPGRWGLDILTNKHRFIFRPLEKLQVQNIGSVQVEEVPIRDENDTKFKPGLLKQVESFLTHHKRLCSIDEQISHLGTYQKINRE